MRVQMKTKIGGYRNEAEWPAAGGFLTVPDHEGRDLIAAGYASEARDADKDEDPAVDAGGDPAADEAGGADTEATGDPAGDAGTGRHATQAVTPAARKPKAKK